MRGDILLPGVLGGENGALRAESTRIHKNKGVKKDVETMDETNLPPRGGNGADRLHDSHHGAVGGPGGRDDGRGRRAGVRLRPCAR